MFVRSLALAGLFLAACGGSETTTEAADDAAASGDHGAETTAPTPAPAAAGAVTCDAYADHFMEIMKTEAEAAGDNEFMTVAQQLEFVGALVEGIREGCKRNDRLADFPEVVSCFMAASSSEAVEGCKTSPNHAAFDEYMKSLLDMGGEH